MADDFQFVADEAFDDTQETQVSAAHLHIIAQDTLWLEARRRPVTVRAYQQTFASPTNPLNPAQMLPPLLYAVSQSGDAGWTYLLGDVWIHPGTRSIQVILRGYTFDLGDPALGLGVFLRARTGRSQSVTVLVTHTSEDETVLTLEVDSSLTGRWQAVWLEFWSQAGAVEDSAQCTASAQTVFWPEPLPLFGAQSPPCAYVATSPLPYDDDDEEIVATAIWSVTDTSTRRIDVAEDVPPTGNETRRVRVGLLGVYVLAGLQVYQCAQSVPASQHPSLRWRWVLGYNLAATLQRVGPQDARRLTQTLIASPLTPYQAGDTSTVFAMRNTYVSAGAAAGTVIRSEPFETKTPVPDAGGNRRIEVVIRYLLLGRLNREPAAPDLVVRFVDEGGTAWDSRDILQDAVTPAPRYTSDGGFGTGLMRRAWRYATNGDVENGSPIEGALRIGEEATWQEVTVRLDMVPGESMGWLELVTGASYPNDNVFVGLVVGAWSARYIPEG